MAVNTDQRLLRNMLWVYFGWAFIGLCLGITITLLFSGCNHLTVAPNPVVAHSIAFSGNVQNGGVVECGKDGCVVTDSWMQHYKRLEKANQNYIGADKDIKAEGVNWRISYEIMNHYLGMRQAERGA